MVSSIKCVMNDRPQLDPACRWFVGAKFMRPLIAFGVLLFVPRMHAT